MFNFALQSITMAIAIKSIPVLKNKAAANFTSKVADNNAKKLSIDFSKHSSIASKILAKSKI
jgi:hypothetical protein